MPTFEVEKCPIRSVVTNYMFDILNADMVITYFGSIQLCRVITLISIYAWGLDLCRIASVVA